MMQIVQSKYFLWPILGYITTSLTLFFYPQIIHTKKVYKEERLNQAIQYPQKVMVVAHRGGSRIGLQNTLETFKKCLQVSNSDMLEMDVCFTKNKQLVVHHDVSLKRTCNTDNHIDYYDYQQLPSFSEVVHLDFSNKMQQHSHGEKIPLLQTIFQQFPNSLMNIQLKTPSIEAIKQFDRLVRKHKMQSKIIWGIRGNLHEELKKTNPNILTFFVQKQVVKILCLFMTGLLPFWKIEDDSLQLPVWTEEYYNWKLNESQNKVKIHAWFAGIKVLNFVFTPIIGHLRRRGILSMGWVCNQEDQYQRALKMGMSGIMTDRPDHLQQYLKKKFK